MATNGSGVLTAVPGTVNGSILSYSAAGPVFTTASFPTTTTANQLLYSSATNVVGGLTSANNGILVTSNTGVPSISSTLPSAVQTNITSVGTVTAGTWNGTAIGPTYGGTGQTALATGDILYASAANTLSRLPAGGNTNVLTMNSSGVPVWAAPSGTSQWTNGTGGAIYYNSGNVGVGTTSPARAFDASVSDSNSYAASSGSFTSPVATNGASLRITKHKFFDEQPRCLLGTQHKKTHLEMLKAPTSES